MTYEFACEHTPIPEVGISSDQDCHVRSWILNPETVKTGTRKLKPTTSNPTAQKDWLRHPRCERLTQEPRTPEIQR